MSFFPSPPRQQSEHPNGEVEQRRLTEAAARKVLQHPETEHARGRVSRVVARVRSLLRR